MLHFAYMSRDIILKRAPKNDIVNFMRDVPVPVSFASQVVHKASAVSLHFFLFAAATLASSHDLHPASALSFSTVRRHVVFGLPLFLFPSGAQVIATFMRLCLSCRKMCPIIFHLLLFTSLLSGLQFACSRSSSVDTWSSQRTIIILRRHLQ